MSDLTQRLRAADPMQMIGDDGKEAADALDAKDAEIRKLRELLAKTLEHAEEGEDFMRCQWDGSGEHKRADEAEALFEIVRAALAGKE